MDQEVRRAWEAFLDPAVTRPRLIAAALYMAAFEILKDAVVDRPRTFYCSGFNQNGEIIDPDYQTKVLSRNRSPVYASLEWMKESGVIVDADIQMFGQAKECRNRVAHGLLTAVASEGLPAGFEERFAEMVELLRKIETWWIREVEIPTSPDPLPDNADLDGIVPGSLLTLQLLCHVALGSDADSRRYLDEFKRQGGV